MRLLIMLSTCMAMTGCGPADSRVQLAPEEQRLLAYLARDPYVVIERTQRTAEGQVLIITSQGSVRQRYLIAPDDPARPDLRLRRLDDACTLDTAPNDRPGGGHWPWGR